MSISISILLTCVIVGVGGALWIWARWRDGRSALAAEAAEDVAEHPCICGHAEASHTLQRRGRYEDDWACADCTVPARCRGRYRQPVVQRICGNAAHAVYGCTCADAPTAGDATAAVLLHQVTEHRLRALHCACGHVVSYHGDDGKCGAFAACRCVAPAPPPDMVSVARRLALRDLARCCAAGACAEATCMVRDRTVVDEATGQRQTIVTQAEIRAVVAAALVEFDGSILCQVCDAQPDRACCWAVHGKHVSPKSETIAAEIKQAWLAALGADVAGDRPDPICPNGYAYSRVWLADQWGSDLRPACDGPCLCGLHRVPLYAPQTKADRPQ